MVRFIIVRHGVTDFNRENRYQGQFDSSLDPVGIEQARVTAEHVSKNYRLDAIYASDLSRTMKTAEPFAKLFGLEVHPEPALREIDVGRWTGRLLSEVKVEDAECFTNYVTHPETYGCPEGESYADVRARVTAALERIADENDGKTVLIVSHGGTIRSLICAWLGYEIKDIKKVCSIRNTSITIAEYEGGKINFTLMGDQSHLPEDLK